MQYKMYVKSNFRIISKNVLCYLLSLAMFFSIINGFNLSVNADVANNGKCGNDLYWEYDSLSNTLIINGTGKMFDYKDSTYNYQPGTYPWAAFYDSIKNVIINEGVTSIGEYAFYNCSSITNIDLPDTLLKINKSAFYWCSSLKSVVIPDSVIELNYFAFNGCTSLTELTISNNLKVIGPYAFCSCPIERLTIPDNVTNIYIGAFNGCNFIKELKIPCSTIIVDGNETFGGCNKIEKITITKGNGVMADFTNNSYWTPWHESKNSLKELIIENGVGNIGSYAFCDMSSLTNITIPNSIVSIEDHAFRDCSALENIVIPNNVKQIGDCAFYGCTSLKCIDINNKYCELPNNKDLLSKDTIIKSYNDSTAFDYAKKYNYQFESLGCYEHSYMKFKVLPTCVTKGYTINVCKECNETFYSDYTDKLSHSYVQKQVIAPTCKSGGHTIYECSECSTTYITDYTDKLENPTLYIYESQLSTCTKQGYVVYFCEDCDDYYSMELLDLADHEYECNGYHNGIVDYSCDVCNGKTTKTSTELLEMFNESVVNIYDDNSYLDVVNDGIINAKDYAKILNLSIDK